jgi:hypothetical protein
MVVVLLSELHDAMLAKDYKNARDPSVQIVDTIASGMSYLERCERYNHFAQSAIQPKI